MTSLEIRKISLKLRRAKGPKILLENVSTTVCSGQLMAIMGGSGCGKTSFLNLIAGRVKSPQIEVSGEILVNGKSSDSQNMIKQMSAYVTQGDFLSPYMTVRETLRFSAMLQLPGSMSKEEKYERVEEVITELGLKDCADTQVGDEDLRGVSGGERRRVSIGTQLLTDPDILFLDEPTTGLDSFTANNLAETLSKLAKEGRIVITTIHQPRSDVFNLFDTVLLMSKGRVIYSGNRLEMLAHFESIGYTCPLNMNPADHFMDLSSVDNRSPDAEKSTSARVDWLVTQWKDKPKKIQDVPLFKIDLKRAPRHQEKDFERAPFSLQLQLVAQRASINLWRAKAFLLSALAECLFISFLLGGVYWQLDGSLAGIKARGNLLYVSCSLQMYLVLIFNIYLQTERLRIFDRERQDNMYGVAAYLLGSQLAELPAHLIFPSLFGSIVYLMSGLRTDQWHHWLVFIGAIVSVHQVVVLFAYVCASAFRRFALASLLGNSIYTFITLSCGLFVQITTVPIYISWTRFFSFVWYGFRLVATNEFTGNTYDCPYGDINSIQCVQYTGARALQDLGFESNDWIEPPFGLFALCVGLWIISFLLLSYKINDPMKDNGSHSSNNPSANINTGVHSLPIANPGMEDSAHGPLGSPPPSPGLVALGGPNHLELEDHILDLKMSLDSSYLSLAEEESPPTAPPRMMVTIELSKVGLVLHRKKNFCSRFQKKLPGATQDHLDQSLRKVPVWRLDQKDNLSGETPLFRSASATEDFELDADDGELDEPEPEQKDPTKMTILENISATISPGYFWVIMGTSGSGKSTLLNLLAGRTFSTYGKLKTSGDIKFNGIPLKKKELKAIIGYVMQDDFLLPSLTVRETLNYAAELRLPKDWTRKQKEIRVEEVILELGLKDCADTVVGSERQRGISGGEKRRVSIAVQLLTDPSILLLDEPTSGLDSFTSQYITGLLKSIASKGRTVICTIHQPRSDVWKLFDMLLVLSKGQVIYQGPATTMSTYFEGLPFIPRCPPLTNPADWLLDVASVDYRSPEAERKTRSRIRKMADAYDSYREEHPIDPTLLRQFSDIFISMKTKGAQTARFTTAFPVLVRRAWTNFIRQPMQVTAKIMQVVALGVILALYYTPLSNDNYSIQNRMGLLQEFNAVIFVGMLNNIAVFPEQRNVFYRERADGAYTTLPFFLSYIVTELPIEIITSILFTFVGSFVLGASSGKEFWVTSLIQFCIINAGESFGITFCALVFNPGFAVTLVSTMLTFFTIMAGYLSLALPGVLDYVNHISMLKYAARVQAANHFKDLTFTCTSQQLLPNGECPFTSGIQVLDLYDFPHQIVLTDVFLMLLFCFLYRVVAYIVLRFRRSQHAT